MVTLLAWWDKIKKDNHINHYHEKRKHVSPFIISVGGMLGREALVVLTNLIQLVTEKMYDPILNVRGWINRRIPIAVTRSYSRMIRISWLSSPLRDRYTDWGLESGLGLAHSIPH